MRFCLVLMSLFVSQGFLKADFVSPYRIAAVVNTSIITKTDLLNRVRFAALSSGLNPTSENLDKMKSQMLRIMIDEQLQLQIGKKYGIEIPTEYLDEAIQDIEENNNLSKGALRKMMDDNNIPIKTFEDQMKAQLTWVIFIREKYPLKTFEDQLGKKQHQEFSPSLQLTDWEIEQEIIRQEKKQTEKQYHLAEIVLPFDRSEQEEEIKNNLIQLHQELQKGAQFSALAQQFSQSATSSQGGDMGWLTEDQLEPEIREVVSQMQPGHLSIPIRTSQGYVVIAFIEQKLPSAGGEMLLNMQQILFPFSPDSTEDERNDIMAKAANIGSTVNNCPSLEKVAKESNPSVSSYLTQGDPLSSFPVPLQEIIQSLDINQASKPIPTEGGALVLMICDKKIEKAQEFSREDAIEIITGRKHARLARGELHSLRRQAFIDIRE